MWKALQNRLRSPDSFVSMILGLAVVLVVGTLIYNYATKRVPEIQKEAEQKKAEEQAALGQKHTVAAGESLWTISEKYYKSGYNWVDLQKANNLSDADAIEVGQELTIPNVTPISPQGEITSTSTEEIAKPQTYTVMHGDTLWSISMKFYSGDGYQWSKIAQANSLANPDLIHAGNVLTLP